MARRAGGRWIVAAVAALAAAVAVIALELGGPGAAGFKTSLRVTGRISLGLFWLTFVTSSVHRLWPGGAGKRLLRNRRTLGLSFAACHFVHLATIAMLAHRHGDLFFAERSLPSLFPGALAYLMLTSMAATSTDRAAARLGARRWKALHKTGMYVIFTVFVGGNAGAAAAGEPWNVAALALLLFGLALRGAARLQLRRNKRSSRRFRDGR